MGRAQPLRRVHAGVELAVQGHVGVQHHRPPAQQEELQLGLLDWLEQAGNVSRPVVGSELSLDPNSLEVGLDSLGDLFVEEVPPVGRAHVDGLVEVEVGLLQEFLGPFGIVLVLVCHLVVPEKDRRNRAVHGQGRVEEDLLNDRLLIHGVVEGLAHQLVLGHALLAVEPHKDGPRVQGHVDPDLRVSLERGHVRGQRLVADVDLAGPEHRLPGGRLGHDLVRQLGHRRLGAVVVLVADQDDPIACDPLLEDVGASAHRLPAHVLAVFIDGRWRDGGHDGRRQRRGERGKGIFELDPDGVVVDDRHLLDHDDLETERNLHIRVEGPVKGQLERLGVERRTVAELDTLSQMDGVGQAVLGDLILGCQARLQLRVRGLVEEGVVNQFAHIDGQRRGLLLRVQGVGIYADADLELLDLGPGVGWSQAETKPRYHHGNKNNRSNTHFNVFHGTPPLLKVLTTLP